MAVKLTMIKEGGRLCPYGDVSWAEFDTIPHGKLVTVSVHQSRNPEHLEFYWSIATAVAKFDDEFHDKDDADHWVRMNMPWMRKQYTLLDGKIGIRVKSIAVESMGEIKFKRFVDRALHLWAEKIGCDPVTLLKERNAA